MKKIIVFCLILSGKALGSDAQVRVPSDGLSPIWYYNNNVGIGIQTPDSKLVVYEDSEAMSLNSMALGFNRNVTDGTIFNVSKSAWQFTSRNERFSLEGYNGAASHLLTVLKNGNVGIGTISPISNVTIVGNTSTSDLYNRTSMLLRNTNPTAGDGLTSFNLATYWAEAGSVRAIFEARYDNGYVNGSTGTSSDHDFNIMTNSTERVRITKSGNVGIGISNPVYKLDVEGTIRAREIKVDLNGADFVFENNYPLMPLDELETFVHKQKHLPEIPTAAKMEAEGTDLGKLNTKLLQKIEELTLYTIEQHKAIEELKRIVAQQNEKIGKLETVLEK
ncbi:MAG: hypothetical protein QM786_06570 [Breznakibacter sp.]